MLFLTYWELNEEKAGKESLKIAEKIMASGNFPPKGVKVLRWDETPDAWGILITEAETAADIILAMDMWRMAGAGFFKYTKTAPAMPMEEGLPLWSAVTKSLEQH